jgi:hypothetical protein
MIAMPAVAAEAQVGAVLSVVLGLCTVAVMARNSTVVLYMGLVAVVARMGDMVLMPGVVLGVASVLLGVVTVIVVVTMGGGVLSIAAVMAPVIAVIVLAGLQPAAMVVYSHGVTVVVFCGRRLRMAEVLRSSMIMVFLRRGFLVLLALISPVVMAGAHILVVAGIVVLVMAGVMVVVLTMVVTHLASS